MKKRLLHMCFDRALQYFVPANINRLVVSENETKKQVKSISYRPKILY